jgi:hypothetical protein
VYKTQLIFFAAPEFWGAGVWALDALEFRTALTMDPARQWRLTPLSATLEVASVRTGLSEPPLLAVRLGHDWLLTGTGPTGVTMPVHPFIGVNNILWQLVAPRDAWPTVGQGWGHEAFTPVTCFQERLPDGSWVLTGSPTHEVPSDRTFWVHFPPL